MYITAYDVQLYGAIHKFVNSHKTIVSTPVIHDMPLWYMHLLPLGWKSCK